MEKKIKRYKLKIRNIIIFFIISGFAYFFQYGFVSAMSGACSWHDGVNCSAGADLDGSVICNDGWRDSDASFFSSIECLDKIHCSLSQLKSLQQKYKVAELLKDMGPDMQEISNIQNQIDALRREMEQLFGNDVILRGEEAKKEREYNLKIIALSQQAMAIGQGAEMKQSQLKQINSIIDYECKALGYDNEQQRMLDKIKIVEELRKELKAQSCPVNSYYLDGKCYCNSGYNWDTLQINCIKTQETKVETQKAIEEIKIDDIQEELIEEEIIIAEEEIQEEKGEEQKDEKKENNTGFLASILDVFKNFFSKILSWF